MFWLPRKTEMNSRGLGLCGCRLYQGMEKSVCDRPRGFWRLPTTTPRTTLIRQSAQDTGIDFRRAMFLINPMRTRLLWIHMNGRNDARNVHDCRSCVSLHRSGSPGSHFRLALRVSGPKERQSLAGQNRSVACAFGQIDHSISYAVADLRVERAGAECAFDARDGYENRS